jgi:tetratricopeptide (TPR) repeat protein
MNTTGNASSLVLKIIGLGFLAIVAILIAVVGCWVLLPIYGKPVAQYLAQQATVANEAGHYDQAIADLTQSIQLDPKNAMVLNNLAWLLATAPDAKSRDGKKAVEYATKACVMTNYQEAADVDTLAAAYAEAGDFDKAVKCETSYLNSLSLSPSDAADGQARLALYQAHTAYHEEK